MGIQEAREYLKKFEKEKDILEFDSSSATVELAAKVLRVEPARIAKTLSFSNGNGAMLIVAAGDVKTDNSKFKSQFGFKARMLPAEEVLEMVGHSVGGVCPFGVKENIPIFLDVSLKRFETVFPACGSINSAIELTCDELENIIIDSKWIDVCKIF